ncbi:hypothetical protein QBC43DRAFT_286089 [Cladorrhinum sp. PSN259]|nr:hypothetical protein QBC43DRAFT_286089 [Cladorrhinum sp. PSN259]
MDSASYASGLLGDDSQRRVASTALIGEQGWFEDTTKEPGQFAQNTKDMMVGNTSNRGRSAGINKTGSQRSTPCRPRLWPEIIDSLCNVCLFLIHNFVNLVIGLPTNNSRTITTVTCGTFWISTTPIGAGGNSQRGATTSQSDFSAPGLPGPGGSRDSMMCALCEREVHSRWVLIREWEHRWLHHRGACSCNIEFPSASYIPKATGAMENVQDHDGPSGKGKNTLRRTGSAMSRDFIFAGNYLGIRPAAFPSVDAHQSKSRYHAVNHCIEPPHISSTSSTHFDGIAESMTLKLQS